MKKLPNDFKKKNNLRLIKTYSNNDMSKIILLIERLKEDERIKYYSVDLILFNQKTHKSEIKISFWGEK